MGWPLKEKEYVSAEIVVIHGTTNSHKGARLKTVFIRQLIQVDCCQVDSRISEHATHMRHVHEHMQPESTFLSFDNLM